MPTQIKICGMTQESDVVQAMELGVDYIGFVLYARSPRAIPAEALIRIARRMGPPCRCVGVFVNEPRPVVERVALEAGLAAVQLHGNEAPDDFRDFPCPVWRAVRVAGARVEPAVEAWIGVDRFLVDASVPGAYGGTGVMADWAGAAQLAIRRPVMLAGGLTAETVAAAVRQVRPLGVDVASGVERVPGRKDVDAMRRFVEAVRSVDKAGPDGDG